MSAPTECPRCKEPIGDGFYGPCRKCRLDLIEKAHKRAGWKALCDYMGRLLTKPPPPRPDVRTPEPPRATEPPLGPCRVCDGPAYQQDKQGPVHACCARVPAGEACLACAYAKTNRNKS